MQKVNPELYKKVKLLGEGTYGKVILIIDEMGRCGFTIQI
jgi:glutathione peroxidase-family protein